MDHDRAMTILKSCLGILSGLVVLVLGAYLVTNLVSTVRAGQLRHELSDDMTRRLAEEVPPARERQGRLVSLTGRAPEHAWIEQGCERNSNDAGWMVQSYRETCGLKVATAWRVDTREEAVALSRARQDHPGGAHDGCESLGTTPEGAEASYVTIGAGQPYCVSDSVTAKRGIDGERVVLPQGTWLYVEDDAALIDETIGCVRWSVVFCDDPWGEKHAWGVPPD